jgi:ATP-binding cassette subfamily B protein
MQRSKQRHRDRLVTHEIHRLFWRANFRDKKNLFITYAGRIPAYAALNTLMPLAGAYGVQAILQRHFDKVGHYALLVIGLGIAYTVFTIIAEFAINKNALQGCKYIQQTVFANFLAKDYDFYANTYFGALGSKATGLREAYNNYAVLVTLSLPKQVTIVVTSILIIASQSLLLAGITLIAMIAVLGFTIASSTWRLRFRREVSEVSSVVSGNIGDALTHGATIKSFASESYEEARLEKTMQVWGKAQYKAWISAFPADTGRMLLASVATAILLLVSAHLYQQGTISITIVVLIQLYVIKLVASTLDIAEIIKRYEEIMGSAYEPVKTMLIQGFVNDKPDAQKITRKSQYSLIFSDASFRYDEAGEDRYAVRKLSLSIRPGEKIGFVGYSGSGKTTLTKLILRFMDVSSGSITLDGIDIRDLKQADLRSIISYVPQEPLLFHRSIGENIAYAKPNVSQKTIQEVARLAYVDEFVDELPNGYDTFVGERGVKLSGGQRQRVAIARALLKDAPILVLDEATSALDSESEKYIQEALFHLMEHRTAIVIAHRLSTIQRMDRIAVMDKGKIVQLGTHKELLNDKAGIYAKLWAHQSGGYIVAETTSK